SSSSGSDGDVRFDSVEIPDSVARRERIMMCPVSQAGSPSQPNSGTGVAPTGFQAGHDGRECVMGRVPDDAWIAPEPSFLADGEASDPSDRRFDRLLQGNGVVSVRGGLEMFDQLLVAEGL